VAEDLAGFLLRQFHADAVHQLLKVFEVQSVVLSQFGAYLLHFGDPISYFLSFDLTQNFFYVEPVIEFHHDLIFEVNFHYFFTKNSIIHIFGHIGFLDALIFFMHMFTQLNFIHALVELSLESLDVEFSD